MNDMPSQSTLDPAGSGAEMIADKLDDRSRKALAVYYESTDLHGDGAIEEADSP